MTIDKIVEFIKHYADSNGYISDSKYLRKDGKTIKQRWLPLTYALDYTRRKWLG